MQSRQFVLAALLAIAFSAHAQQAAPPASETTPTITKEAGIVIVDTVVTDKQGNYIRDLTQKDFRIFEDGKEQPVKSFSSESNAAAPTVNPNRYLVLFFDNSTMSVGDQAQARAAALKFLDSNTGPNRYIAIVNFSGTLQIAQNFTTDAARLKAAAQGQKVSSVSPNAAPDVSSTVTPGVSQLGNMEANFGARTLLLALRDLAKGLASVPGRKSLVLLSSGFPMNASDPNYWVLYSELTAAIDACNKSNVAIYAIDARGVGAVSSAPPLEIFPTDESPRLISATLDLSDDDKPVLVRDGDQDATAHLVYVQKGGGGGGGGRGTGGTGGAGGTRGTNTGVNGNATSQPTILAPNAPFSNAKGLVPTVGSGAHNQDVLYELAQGTGGFVIGNTNDLVGGLQKIAAEQGQYYLLSYTPPTSEEGSCHTLKVKVDRGNSVVRSRSGYCNVRPSDVLAGKPIEKQLENQVAGSQPGNVAASMQAPYFYTSTDVARVDLAIDIPAGAVKFEKKNGKQHAEVNVLGVAYKPDGSVGARFSDNVEFNFDSKDMVEAFGKQPYHYETQFELSPGHYDLKVAFTSGGTNFGKLQMPLVVDNYDGKQLSMSTVALSTEIHPLNQASASLDAELLEDRKPLVAQGMEIVPTAGDHFKKTDPAVFYIEIYDPLLTGANPPKVGLQLKVVDRKTGAQAFEMHGLLPNDPGNPVVSLGMRLPLDKLNSGSYELQLTAIDTAGHQTSAPRTADFEVE